jgi:hypothetical protein
MPRITRIKGTRPKNDTSIEAFIRVNKKLYTKTFPKPVTPEDVAAIRKWRDDTKAANGTMTATGDGFGADVDRYLSQRSSIPSIRKIGGVLRAWVRALGADRHRHTITTDDVNARLNDLNARLAPGTVINHRTALRAFFYYRDPKRGNPVRGSFHPGTPKAEPRGRDMALIARAIDAMFDTRCSTGKPSLAKIRARVVAFTGLPPAILKEIKSSDLRPNPTAPTHVLAPRRKKGGGVESRLVPLTEQGSAAFVTFHQANAYGKFRTETVNQAFKAGCRKVDIDPTSIVLYDARHSFLTQIYRTTKDTDTVGRFGLHAEGSPLPSRYTKVAHEDVDNAVAIDVSAALSAAMSAAAPKAARRRGTTRDKKLAAKVGRDRKLALVS